MTFADGIDLTENVLTLAALVGAIWSAISFVKKLSEDQEDKRKRKLDMWRKVALHKIISNSQHCLSVDEIKQKLRADSFYANVEVRKEDLSDDEIRLLLLEMVGEGVLGQIWPDTFGITQLPRDITLPLTADHLRGNLAVRAAFNLIYSYPGQYDDDRLWDEVGAGSGLRRSDFILSLRDLSLRSAAAKDEGGAWWPSVRERKGQVNA